MSKTHRDRRTRRHNYRADSGRCEVCGARLEAGDWHERGVQCAHCLPKFETEQNETR